MNPPNKPPAGTPSASQGHLVNNNATKVTNPTPAPRKIIEPDPAKKGSVGSAGSRTSPAPGGQPPITQQPTTNVMLQVMAPEGVMPTGASTAMQCPHCKTQMVTHVTPDHGCCVYLSMGLCCLFGCWLGCFLLPLWMPDLQDGVHTCPNCKKLVGTYKRL